MRTYITVFFSTQGLADKPGRNNFLFDERTLTSLRTASQAVTTSATYVCLWECVSLFVYALCVFLPGPACVLVSLHARVCILIVCAEFVPLCLPAVGKRCHLCTPQK